MGRYGHGRWTAAALAQLYCLAVPAGCQQASDIERILNAPQEKHAELIEDLVAAGPQRIRELDLEARGRSLTDNQVQHINAVLRQARARLMNVTGPHVEALDLVLDYDGGPEAEDTIRVLAAVLENGAADSDFGRAEVLRALFHVYEVLLTRSPDERQMWKPRGSPRDLFLPVVLREIGPEETRVLDERVHLLLFHDWISHIRAVDRLVFRLIESKHLSNDLYEALHTKMLETLSVSCRRQSGREAGDKAQPSRSSPEQWPCLPHRLFMPLWKSPVATDQQREMLYNALEEVLLSGEAEDSWVRKCSPYLSWLRQNGWMRREQVQAYLDRVMLLGDPAVTGRGGHLPTLFPDVYEACPHWRSRHSLPKWQDFKTWWQQAGREIAWTPAFEQPLAARVFVVVEASEEGGAPHLLTASASLNHEVPVETECDSPWGPLRFRIHAWPSLREKGVTVFSLTSEQLVHNPWSPVALKTPYARHTPRPERMRNGVHARIAESYIYRSETGSLRAMVVLIVDDTERIEALAQTGIEGLFQLLRRRLPVGFLPDDNFPGDRDDFLPLRYRLELVHRFLEVADEPEFKPEWRKSSIIYNRLKRIAKFASEHGDPSGRDALLKWIDRQWPYWENMRKSLSECEQLLLTASASGNAAQLFDLLAEPDRWDDVLNALVDAKVRENLSGQEKDKFARFIAGSILPREKSEARKFSLIIMLRELSGLQFGYEPFSEEDKQAQAVQQWSSWGGEAP